MMPEKSSRDILGMPVKSINIKWQRHCRRWNPGIRFRYDPGPALSELAAKSLIFQQPLRDFCFQNAEGIRPPTAKRQHRRKIVLKAGLLIVANLAGRHFR